MKLNNFESAIVYLSKYWFDDREDFTRSEWAKLIWGTTYNVNIKWMPDYNVIKVIVRLLIKIMPTQRTTWFSSTESFTMRIISIMAPSNYEHLSINLTHVTYWRNAFDSVLSILSEIQVRGDEISEEIEIPEFEEIKDWILNHKYNAELIEEIKKNK